MDETILFCFVFLSQILLMSWIYPRRIISRVRFVLQNYPPSTHSRGYTHPVEYYERWLRNIARCNLVVLVVGFLVIGLILGALTGAWNGGIFASSRHGDWATGIVVPMFLVQLVAGFGYMNFSGRKLMLAMAKAPPPRVRTAELHRRRIFDFVSPSVLVIAALTNAAFIAFIVYDYVHFGLPAQKAVSVLVSVVLMLLAFAVTVVAALRARKADPYQADRDRRNALKMMVRQTLAVCIAYPVLLALWLIIKIFDQDFLEPVIASLYCQGIALALLWPSYSYRVDEIDFDVYRADAGAIR